VWEAAPGKAVSEPLRHDGSVTSAGVSPDGKWIVTASADHTARIWEAATGKAVGQPLRHDVYLSPAFDDHEFFAIVSSVSCREGRVRTYSWIILTG